MAQGLFKEMHDSLQTASEVIEEVSNALDKDSAIKDRLNQIKSIIDNEKERANQAKTVCLRLGPDLTRAVKETRNMVEGLYHIAKRTDNKNADNMIKDMGDNIFRHLNNAVTFISSIGNEKN